MRSIVKVFVTTIALSFVFSLPVYAATYQADELVKGQYLEAGDTIEFGHGVFNGEEYERVVIYYNGLNSEIIRFGDSTTLLEPYYVYGNNGVSNGTNGSTITLYLSTIYSFFSEGNNHTPLPFYSDFVQTLTINEGERKRVYIEREGGTEPFSIEFVGVFADESFATCNGHDIEHGFDYVDIEYGEYGEILYAIHDSNGKGFGPYAGHLWIENRSNNDVDIAEESAGVNPSSDEESKDEDKKHNNDSHKQEDEEKSVVQIPSTVPNNTIQVSIGNNGGFANVKALNPYLHDSLNQKILADLYAKNLNKRANVLMQKNLIPPYGVDGTWRNQSHMVKKGDQIVIIWYTPKFGIHAPTLKYIPATVVEDGTIEFTIPAMGDMSVMSIVKLI